MQLATDGFTLVQSLLSDAECEVVAQSLGAADTRGAGSRRLLDEVWCAELAGKVMAHPDVREALPARARAVQCTYFEKSAAKNWLVPIHQDLSIPVSGRVDHAALSGWSEKEGATFVQALTTFSSRCWPCESTWTTALPRMARSGSCPGHMNVGVFSQHRLRLRDGRQEL